MNAETLTKPRMILGAEAALQALDYCMERDPNVLLFGEDVADREGGGVMGASKGLSTKYGDMRVRSTPIAEQAIIGAAIGSAIAGMRPVAEIMLFNFITVAMDQIVNHAAKIRYMSGGQTSVPLTIRTQASVGAGLGGQHSDMYEAWFAHVPGIKVVVPSNHADWTGLLTEAILDDDPVLFVEPLVLARAKGVAAPIGHRVPLGKAAVAREGTDVTIVGYGRPIIDALAVAEKLAKENISVEVVDLRTVSPWDKETVLSSVAKTGRCVVTHEAVREFGCGAEIAATISEELFGDLKAAVRRVASRNTPVPVSPPLERAFMWSQPRIEAAVRQTLA